MSIPSLRPLRPLAVGVVAVGCLATAAPQATAAVERFHRFEIDATANYTILTDCPDGSTAQTRVSVIGGREKEQENGVSTLDSQFVTVFVQSLDCDGNFDSDQGSGPADFSAARSLSRASVVGTITTSGGSTVDVLLRYRGTGDLERTRNVTQFPGFRGVFVGREREASATGTVTIDGTTLIDGSTDDALVETLEDRNVTRTDP